VSYPQVVRVFCTNQVPDYESPWQSLAPRSCTGSGVVVGPGRILTGAHVVANATFLQVQKQSVTAKAVAHVQAISHDSDLALLKVEDPAFTRGIRPAVLGDLPRLRDGVSVVGYPVGGEEVSITEGVVSRVEVQRYEHSQRHLLAITVDAAINDGNSGGPVFGRGKVIGIAFQGMPDAENVGEMVPAPVIKRFMTSVRTRRSPLVPWLGVGLQSLEGPSMRKWLGLRESEGGMLVNSVQFGGSAGGVLRTGDVLLELDGHKIAGNGTISYKNRFRCRLEAILGDHFLGERVPARILREKKRQRVTLTLGASAYLVPRQQYDQRPAWFQFGGMVFQKLTSDYLRIWGEHWWDKAPKELLYLFHYGQRTETRREVVVLAQVLADPVNVGYEGMHSEVIAEVNGHAPRDLADFVARVDAARDEIVLRTGTGWVVHLDARAARAAQKRILAKYNVPADRAGIQPSP